MSLRLPPALLLAVGIIGCSSNGDHLAPVKGKVTYKGAPLQGGTIVFIPDESRGTHGQMAMADIQADGTFTLKTNDTLGAVPGWHRVTVAWVVPGPAGRVRPLLPDKYSHPQQSGLAFEVHATKPNAFALDLE
jgi:hypothetical protein